MTTEKLRRTAGRATPLLTVVTLWVLAGAGCSTPADEALKAAATAQEAAIVIVEEATSSEAAAAADEGAAVAAADGAVTASEPAETATGASIATDAPTSDSAIAALAPPLAGVAPSRIDEPAAETAAQLLPPTIATADRLEETREPVDAATPTLGEAERASDDIESSVAASLSAGTLDFKSLATRLRKTKAISLRTKVAVKRESDHLLERFRAYHAEAGTVTLAELRRSYDALFLKLYSLLEDADPPLARDIDRSRAAIWAILTDPLKFRTTATAASKRSEPPA